MSTNVALIQSDRKLDGLHGLRAVAALTVVLFHLQYMSGQHLSPWLSMPITLFYLSVHLFFVVSAFSLYHSSRYAPASHGAYLVKRFFRIAPLYYVIIAYVLWHNGFPGWLPLASNLTFTFNLIPGQETSMTPGGWSVGVEMLFYLLLPLLLFMFRGWRVFAALYLMAAVLSVIVWKMTSGAVGLRPDFAYYSLACNLPAFFAGLLAYSVFMSWDEKPRHAWVGIVLMLTFGLLLAAAFFDPLNLHWHASGLYFAFWGLPFGVVCLWQALYPSALMRTRPIQWLADRSYSIYLLHPAVILLIRPAFEQLHVHGIPEGDWLYGASLALTLPILLAAAQVTYRFVELPGIALGRRIAARMNTSGKRIPA